MYSFSEIVNRIKELLKNEGSKIEGTFTMDNVQAVSQELAFIHNTEIAPIIDAVFLDTATGENLDRRAADFNETRQAATPSVGELLFLGTANSFVPKGTKARFDSLFFATVVDVRLDDAGGAVAVAMCEEPGTVGNVPGSAVSVLAQNVPGVLTVINPLPFEGGTDTETDEALRERVYEKIRYPVTSGNEHYYEYLARQVSGVYRAKCQGTWNGPGTALLVLLSSSGGTPDAVVIDNVRRHVEAQRLIGADITYRGAVPLEISIEGSLVLSDGYDIADVQSEVEFEFSAYFEQVSFDRKTEFMSYHKAIELVFRADGVQDILTLTLNGSEASIDIPFDAFLSLLEVNLSAS